MKEKVTVVWASIIVLLSFGYCVQSTIINADFESAFDCSKYVKGPHIITNQDKIYATATGRQSDFGGANDCKIQIKTHEQYGRLRIFTKKFEMRDCGVTLEIYEQNRYLQNPRWKLDCHTQGNLVYVTNGDEATIRLSKISPSAFSYTFDIQITTDESPEKEDPQGVVRPTYQRSTLTEGAIIGISVSCVIGIGVLVVIIIIVIVKKRRERRQSARRPKEAEMKMRNEHY